ncbi:hypothetical protein [Hyphomicrobium sp. CS1GBMeth3]|uniref:hypothetical protein n=1 Tax=Hyphomicrobium sp. CS1GBMeth3 TaxID=1892845 RepID=UPI0009301FFB|nr:hypothetical protein [Hyphomicrobium sp. CS1GBMeth3]
MGNACQPTTFSIAKDGKYHDATYTVEGDVVSVLYWGRDGVTRREAQTTDPLQPQQTACQLLSEMIETQPQMS